MFAAGGCVKEDLFSVSVEAKVRLNFSFAKRLSFFLAYVAPTSCQGLLGISAFYELIFFNSFSFLFSNHYSSTNQAQIDQRVMTMKVLFKLLGAPEQEPHHLIEFSIKPRIPIFGEGILPFCREYSHHVLVSTDRKEKKRRMIKK